MAYVPTVEAIQFAISVLKQSQSLMKKMSGQTLASADTQHEENSPEDYVAEGAAFGLNTGAAILATKISSLEFQLTKLS